MKTFIQLLVLILGLLIFITLIPSCIALPTQSDPYSLQAQAEHALNIAHAQMTATAQAEIMEAEKEILQQAQTQAADSQKATATALVFNGMQTQAAATLTQAARETAQAVHGTETAIAVQKLQAGATATQSAMETLRIIEATSTQHAVDLAALTLEREKAQLQREKLTRWALWGVLIAGIALTLILGMYVMKVLTLIHDRQKKWIPGAGTYVFETPGGPVVLDPRRMFGAAAVITAKTQAVTAPTMAPDPLYQWLTTQGAQWVELVRAAVSGYHPPYPPSENSYSPKMLSKQNSPALLHDQNGIADSVLPRIAPWRLLEDWHGGGLPLGLGESGLLLADPENNPHLLIAGTSGSGKTRYGLRPVITSALADGWQVVIFDRSGLDFLPFQNHPNTCLIMLPNPAQAIQYLYSLIAEIQKRFVILREAGVSTWGRLAGAEARVLAVFDEFSNLADALSNSERDELWRGARMVAAEGRKAGVHLALALQDPTHKSIDLRIRRNCTPLAFRVLDEAASRVVLNTGGADTLPPRQFLTVLNTRLCRGVAFSPGDQEIEAFLDNRPVTPLPPPIWLAQVSTAIEEAPEDEVISRIRALHAQNLSLNEIQRQVFGYVGGKAYETVRKALEKVVPKNSTVSQGNTTTADGQYKF
ncbi:MAG: hypothetical protein Fur0022_02640 [Anaerolineales bacterium]